MGPLNNHVSITVRHGPGGHTSTHLSGFLVETFAVVTLAVASRHQTLFVRVITQAATTVAGAWQRQQHVAHFNSDSLGKVKFVFGCIC